MKTFISYSSKNIDFINKLVPLLKKDKIDMWFDQWEIKVGDSIITKIENALNEVNGLIIIISKESIKSKWVRKELSIALMQDLSKKDIKIFPVLIDYCEMPNTLSEFKYADFRTDFKIGYNQLLKAFDTSNKDEGKSNFKRYINGEKRLENHVDIYKECYSNYSILLRNLTIVSSIITEAWYLFSEYENDRNNIGRPFMEEDVRLEVADLIISNIIKDSRLDNINCLVDPISNKYNTTVTKDSIYFDKNIFIQDREKFQRKSPFYRVITEIVYDQIVFSISRFASRWTIDIKIQDNNYYKDYIKIKYEGIYKSKNENFEECWTKWIRREGEFKALAFYERTGRLSHYLFYHGDYCLWEDDPFIVTAASVAFDFTRYFLKKYDYS